MIPPFRHAHIRVAHARAAALLASTLLLGACASAPAALPSPSTNAEATPSPSLAVKPSFNASVVPSVVATIKANASAPDSGVHDTLVAHKFRFAQATLAGPADKVWHIDFDQQDDKGSDGREVVKHSVAIAAGVSRPISEITFDDRLFMSKVYTVGKYTIDVGGLPAGSYTFWCTVHPEIPAMQGVLTIR
jgi:hypothetical protein